MKAVRPVTAAILAACAALACTSVLSGCSGACDQADASTVVAHWTLDAVDGAEFSDETGRHPATVGGVVEFGSAGAATFPGDTTAAWAAHDSILDLVDGFTIEATIRPTRLGNPHNGLGVQAIAEKHIAPGGYLLVLTPTGRLLWWLEAAEGQTKDSSTVAVALDGAWHHVAMTWDRETVRLYVDGKAAGEHAFAGPLGRCSQDLFLGNDDTLAWGFQGDIADIRISNVALTPDKFRRVQ